MWEHFEHQADMGVRGVGNTRDEAFEQAALALTAVVVPPESIEARESVRVTCTGDDEELLLLDWMAAIVYQMSANRMVFGGFAVRIDGSRLDAELWGEPLDPKRHQPGVEVKAATATALHVGQRPDGSWVAQCVVDV
jgi:tRNA nucleotidyltransferase (CCA-adding enzyme)